MQPTSFVVVSEVKMFVDGDTEQPTIAGTGTEDYIGTGWGMGKFTHRYQGCTVADRTNRLWAFYRFHIPDPVCFQKDFKAVIQTIGGAGTSEVRELLKRGASLTPISVDADGKFLKLLNPSAPRVTDSDFPEGWVNFYRQDDYCATAYFYLDRPAHLPPLPPLEARLQQLGR